MKNNMKKRIRPIIIKTEGSISLRSDGSTITRVPFVSKSNFTYDSTKDKRNMEVITNKISLGITQEAANKYWNISNEKA